MDLGSVHSFSRIVYIIRRDTVDIFLTALNGFIGKTPLDVSIKNSFSFFFIFSFYDIFIVFCMA